MKLQPSPTKMCVQKTLLLSFGLLLACSGESVEEGHGNANDQNLEKHEVFTESQCMVVVKKVQDSGKYTEESIEPVCNAEMKSPKCEFFAEALSLASSHTDFNGKSFCFNINEARFCSGSMDRILQSSSVADLAYGECLRAKPIKGDHYCDKFQKMLAFAVNNEDLDTMRACYMIEAYSGSESKEPDAPSTTPEAKVPTTTTAATPKAAATTTTVPLKIVSGAKEQKEFGKKGETPLAKQATSTIGQAAIIVKPEPVEKMGDGKGTGVKPTAVPAIVVKPAPAKTETPAAQPADNIVVLQGHKAAKTPNALPKAKPVAANKVPKPSATKPPANEQKQPASKKRTASIVTQIVPLHPLAGHGESGSHPLLAVVQKAKPLPAASPANLTATLVKTSAVSASKPATSVNTSRAAVAAKVVATNSTPAAKSNSAVAAKVVATNSTPAAKSNSTVATKVVATPLAKGSTKPALVRVTAKVQAKKVEDKKEVKQDEKEKKKNDKNSGGYGGFLSAFVN